MYYFFCTFYFGTPSLDDYFKLHFLKFHFHSSSYFSFFSGPYYISFKSILSCKSYSLSFISREGNGTPVQYSGLENPMDGGAWKSAVPGVTEGLTRLSDFTFTFHFSLSCIGEGNGNPLQCSCLENPRDGGASWAAVYGVAQSQTRLK